MDLPLRLSTIALPDSGRTARVVYSLEVRAPLRDLQEADGRFRDTLACELVVVDEKKGQTTTVSKLDGRLTMSPHADAASPPDVVVYQIDGEVMLPPGRYQFRLSAISAKAAKGGSVYLDVDVPNYSDVVSIGGIALGYANGRRVPVASAVVPTSRRGTSANAVTGSSSTSGFPSALPFAPTLDRVFERGDTLRVFVPGRLRNGQSASVTIEVVDQGEHVVTTAGCRLDTIMLRSICRC